MFFFGGKVHFPRLGGRSQDVKFLWQCVIVQFDHVESCGQFIEEIPAALVGGLAVHVGLVRAVTVFVKVEVEVHAADAEFVVIEECILVVIVEDVVSDGA